MEHKVEIWNRGDEALEVVYPSHTNTDAVVSHVLNPNERVSFDAAGGIGIGPVVVTPPPVGKTDNL